ncbi:MAG: DNA methyltransferase, partial [Alphaproteobacteria bacterium]
MNHLYYGDNLRVLRESVGDESVDLIYLDPPFNSNASYNVLFKGPAGTSSAAQIEAFDDTWHWNDSAEEAFGEVVRGRNAAAATMLRAIRQFLGDNDMMAYLAMMAVRLIELHRVLKPTGSLYLHCDPTASHYLKVLLDAVFGAGNFKNEISWKRTSVHGDSKTWSRVADKIFFVTKGKDFTWNTPYEPLSDEYKESHYSNRDENGRNFQLTSILSPSPRPNMMYEWNGFESPPMGWRFSKERMAELDEAGLIWYPRSKSGDLDFSKRPRFKRYLDEQKGTVLSTIWTDIPPLNAQAQERLG